MNTSTTQPVVSFENVSVRYRVPRESFSGLKEYTIRFMQRRLAFEDFWALKEVSFEIQKGEIFGIIGKNGSGKSTLLKVIARVLTPTLGRILIRGKVAPLLELGAGFHQELTGRENVYLNSALLGRTKKDVERLLPEITEFAEIGDFMEAPLRTYSTGMVARLGFAVATAERPEILLVDEVLSVGDAAFQQKCLDRMYSFQGQGTTVIMVSHSMATIEAFCDRGLWLDKGDAKVTGGTQEVIKRYIEADKVQEAVEETQTPLPQIIATPIFRAKPEIDIENKCASLPETHHIYPADPILSVRHGTILLWHRFLPQTDLRTSILFHSDDSRYVLYTTVDPTDPDNLNISLTARAGGNRRVMETYFGQSRFPEISISLNNKDLPYPIGSWHLLTMTWDGFPDGKLSLYIDAQLVGEMSYDRRYDNNYRLAENFSVGVRPPQWVGELIQNDDGTVEDSRPQAILAVDEGGQQIENVCLYQFCLSLEEIQNLYKVERSNFSPELE